MKICIVTFLAAGGIWAGAIHSPHAQSQPPPVGKPAAIIITNAPLGGKGAKPYLSSGLQEILKMHEAGVDKSVILAFVQSASVAYHPSANEVIYLRDEGVSTEIISAMLKRGGDLRDRAAELQREELRTRQIEQPPPAPAPAEPVQPQSTATAAPQTTRVVYASPPVYNTYPPYRYNYVTYPSYSYARPWYRYSYAGYRPYYWPSISFGYRSSCYPRFGLSVGFGGYHGAWRFSGGGHGGRHCS